MSRHELITLFFRYKVQWRYFNVCVLEMLSKCFDRQEPSAQEALTKRKTGISDDRLLT
jgi:hypothetical protein